MSDNGTFSYSYRVRYIDCDMQGVVYNAHYLTFVDDCIEGWMRSLGATGGDKAWDFMLKKAEVVWSGSATYGDTVTVVPRVARWGRTSFAVAYDGLVGEREVFTAEITYVSVVRGTTETMETPSEVRTLLGEPAPA